MTDLLTVTLPNHSETYVKLSDYEALQEKLLGEMRVLRGVVEDDSDWSQLFSGASEQAVKCEASIRKLKLWFRDMEAERDALRAQLAQAERERDAARVKLSEMSEWKLLATRTALERGERLNELESELAALRSALSWWETDSIAFQTRESIQAQEKELTALRSRLRAATIWRDKYCASHASWCTSIAYDVPACSCGKDELDKLIDAATPARPAADAVSAVVGETVEKCCAAICEMCKAKDRIYQDAHLGYMHEIESTGKVYRCKARKVRAALDAQVGK
jgi:hypothetical protein